MRRLFVLVAFITCTSLPVCVSAAAPEMCLYQDAQGKVVQVNSRSRVPVSHRDQARCFSSSENTYLAKPEEVELKGTVRREDMSSLRTVPLSSTSSGLAR